MQDHAGKFARGIQWSIASGGLIGLTNFVALIVFARILGPDAIGSYGFAVVALDLAAGLLSFGFNQAVIRHPSDCRIYSAAFVAICLQSVAFVGLGTIVYVSLLADKQQSALIWLTLGAARIATFFGTLFYAELEAAIDYRPIVIYQLVATLLGTATGLAIAYLAPAGPLALALRDLCSASLLLVLSWRHERAFSKLRMSIDYSALKELWSFSRRLWQLNILERLAFRVEYMLIGRAFSPTDFGMYFAVRGIVEGGLGFILKPIQTVLYAYYCRVHDGKRHLIRQLTRVLPALAALTLVVTGVAYISGPQLVLLALGSEYLPASPVLIGLAAYAFSIIFFELQKVLAMAANIHEQAIWGRVAQIGLGAILVLAVVRSGDFLSAGIVSAVSAIVLASITCVLIFRRMNRPSPLSAE